MIKFEVTKEAAGQRLDVFLKGQISEVSREKVKRAILGGKVYVNGPKNIDPSFIVAAGNLIEIEIDTKPFKLKAENISLKKIYEDDDFLVIDKPAGLVVHPGANVTTGTLANALLGEYPQIQGLGHEFRPGIIHRLDKGTSGLMLIAKNEKSFEYGKALFEKRLIAKEYETLVFGRLEPKFGVIEKPLRLVPERRRVEVSAEGKAAKTEYRVLGYFEDSDGIDFYSLVRVILHTGRTHQIRVHFASLGHPVAGDSLYSADEKTKKAGPARQFLHAKRLAFRLPNGTMLDLESELPADLQDFLNSLQKIES
ncbi:MAG: hypothetical protein A3J48_02485 [Candidatus Doudnabacteria bacterium RIFCSPHIGHO2_02_FULL_46_11]|uniref:Pseudouridine synthase n=1 Tax=Candidatus Doudnabacteria bacterium RIFCSPHIGHO2_02_FULL_46_11 TaxID=1817832 RepID=A0A1F5P9E8_9BACT|nr:MAG: hypothetical protein A3J48_02485 [Candidatus Doudnabacteria bacterium RIFCSPHIGHO2_02_FULL_46_11]